MRLIVSTAFLAVIVVAGCAKAPVESTLVITPGPGKTDDVFKADQLACKTAAAQATASAANAANQAALTGAVTGVVGSAVAGGGTGDAANTALTGAQQSQAANGTLQQQFDQIYGNCMYSRGNIVPGMAPPPPPPPPEPEPEAPVRNHLVMQVQQQLERLGYLSGGADGIAGHKTAAAIAKYETDHGLNVDGVSTRSLLHALQADHGSGGSGWVMPTATPSADTPSGGTPAPSK